MDVTILNPTKNPSGAGARAAVGLLAGVLARPPRPAPRGRPPRPAPPRPAPPRR